MWDNIGINFSTNHNNLPMGNSIPHPIEDAKKYLSEHGEYVDKSLKYVLGISAIGIVGYILRKELGDLYTTYVLSEESKRSQGAKKLLGPIKIDEKPNYVPRKELEETLNSIIGSIDDEKYVILVGQKGSGKTTVLRHAVNGKKGIAVVKINGKTTLQNLEQKLLESIDVHIEKWNQNKAQEVFGEICASIRTKEDNKVKWLPTVIFEVDGNTPKEIIKELYKIAKQLSSDKVQARCIIVMSDANACLSMTSDPPRQRYIWVTDFTEEEANQYLTKAGFTNDQETRKMVFDMIGTRPSFLRDIASSKMNPKEFIENQIVENVESIKKMPYKRLKIQRAFCGYDERNKQKWNLID